MKYYYHGSSAEITDTYLKPRPSRVLDGEKAVFATNKRYISLMFIPKWSDSDIEFGFINDKPYAREIYPNAFNILKNVSGYIYYLDSKGFKTDKRLGLQGAEFINKKKVKILESEYIKDAYKELKKSDIKFITFDDYIKCIHKML